MQDLFFQCLAAHRFNISRYPKNKTGAGKLSSFEVSFGQYLEFFEWGDIYEQESQHVG